MGLRKLLKRRRESLRIRPNPTPLPHVAWSRKVQVQVQVSLQPAFTVELWELWEQWNNGQLHSKQDHTSCGARIERNITISITPTTNCLSTHSRPPLQLAVEAETTTPNRAGPASCRHFWAFERAMRSHNYWHSFVSLP
jgi:hypothetical protein